MENFQLYRTNILLGGQLKWNLIIDKNINGELEVSDLHLSPINAYAPKYQSENLLNNSHQENLRMYYKNHEGIFFKNQLHEKLSHDYVVLEEGNENNFVGKLYDNDLNQYLDNKDYAVLGLSEWVDSNGVARKSGSVYKKSIIYDDSLEAGPSYGKYGVYKKPIEIFCPLWLEQVKENVKIEIIIYSSTDKKIATKTITLDNSTKFGKYFVNYLKFIGLDKGCDDVMNVDFSNKTSMLTGVDVISGLPIKIDTSNIVHNLLYRERPMMEFDSMLINMFSDNHSIARQLFNFNICLDINDILSSQLSKMIYGKEFKFEVVVYVDGKKLEMKDFYSNYNFIKKDDITIYNLLDYNPNLGSDKEKEAAGFIENQYNVLDYLYDYNYINHINKNKYIQNVIHWSLSDNSDYIFNLYNGFGPCRKDGNEMVFYSHKYGIMPDLLTSEYSEYLNNIGWCNVIDVTNYNHWLNLVNNMEGDLYKKVKEKSSDFNKKWVNNIKYNYNKEISWDEFRLNIFRVSEKSLFDNIKLNMDSSDISINDNLVFMRLNKIDEMYGIVVYSEPDKDGKVKYDEVTFAGFIKLLNDSEIMKSLSNTHPLMYLKCKLETAKQIPLVSIDKSLFINHASSPSMSSSEIEYYKDDEIGSGECYMLRYDGKIKPTFINFNDDKYNLQFFKRSMIVLDDKCEELDNSNFNKYIKSGYPPLYPSIGYCAYDSRRYTYEKNNKKLYILASELHVELMKSKDESIKDLIIRYLNELYDIANGEDVYDLYNIEYSYDYLNPSDLNNYVYDVKLILK